MQASVVCFCIHTTTTKSPAGDGSTTPVLPKRSRRAAAGGPGSHMIPTAAGPSGQARLPLSPTCRINQRPARGHDSIHGQQRVLCSNVHATSQHQPLTSCSRSLFTGPCALCPPVYFIFFPFGAKQPQEPTSKRVRVQTRSTSGQPASPVPMGDSWGHPQYDGGICFPWFISRCPNPGPQKSMAGYDPPPRC